MNAQEFIMGICYRLFKHFPYLLSKIMLQRLCLNINFILNHGLFLWDAALEVELLGESPRMLSEVPDTLLPLGLLERLYQFSLPQE